MGIFDWLFGKRSSKKVKGDVSDILSLINKLGSFRTDLSFSSVAEELIKIGKPAVPALIQNIRKSDYIPIILGKIGDLRAVEPLLELAKSPGTFESDTLGGYKWYSAECAMHALGALGDERALPLLSAIAKETKVAELFQAATKAKEKIELNKTPSSSGILKGKSDWELQRMAKDEKTSQEILDVLADHPSWRIRAIVAMNSSASIETLRKLSKKTGTADGPQADRNVHYQLVNNPNCPSDVLAFIEKCSIGTSAAFVKDHPNYMK